VSIEEVFMTNESLILVVDDEPAVCKSVVSALSDQGYTLIIAMSGEEGLEKSDKLAPDLVIVDLMMPGMSGMDLLKAMKDHRKDTVVVMITGYPSIKTAVQAIRLGAFDYLPKPFTPTELRSLVSRALESRKINGKSILTTPKGLFCIPENSWAKVEENGQARVGVHHSLLQLVEKVVKIEFPAEGEIRRQGEALTRITDAQKRLHRAWTPVSGRIVEINDSVRENPLKLVRDPYGDGWLVIIDPIDLKTDLKDLISSR
jgi:DNA-binding response OmpR family regulator